jgi:hypothetical protein
MDSYFRFIYNLFHEIFFNILYFRYHLWLQPKKVLQTKFTTDKSPSTESWMRPYGNPPEATNFIMFQPDNGRPIRK